MRLLYFLYCIFVSHVYHLYHQLMTPLFGIGGFEILLIFLVSLLLFGSKQLPEITNILGKSWKEIKQTTKEVSNEFKTQAETLEKERRIIHNQLKDKKKEE